MKNCRVKLMVFLHDYPLACKIPTVKTLALRYNSGILLTIVINDKNAICCIKPISNWKFDEYFELL